MIPPRGTLAKTLPTTINCIAPGRWRHSPPLPPPFFFLFSVPTNPFSLFAFFLFYLSLSFSFSNSFLSSKFCNNASKLHLYPFSYPPVALTTFVSVLICIHHLQFLRSLQPCMPYSACIISLILRVVSDHATLPLILSPACYVMSASHHQQLLRLLQRAYHIQYA